MIKEKIIEPQEHSSVKLTITVDKEALKKEYDDLVKKYCKTVEVKGFRKGKVPPSILIRKFGDTIKNETFLNVMEKSLEMAIEDVDKKPLPLDIPHLENDLNIEEGTLEKDFTFTVTYDTYPEIKLGKYTDIEIEEPVVNIKDEDVERELKALQEQNSVIADKREGSTVEKDNIITISYVELDNDGNEIEDTKRDDYVFTVGSGYNLYRIDDDVIGMKKGEEKIIEKDYPEDYDFEELRGKKKRLKVKVNAIKEKQLPEIDDELAQDISDKYNTLKDLKDDIYNKLKEVTSFRVRIKNIDSLLDKILNDSETDLPQSMINTALDNYWSRFISRLNTTEKLVLRALEIDGKSKQSLYEEWRPSVEKDLKIEFLIEEMIKKEKIDADDSEIDEKIKEYAEINNIREEELANALSNESLREHFKKETQKQKLFDFLLENARIKKGEEINLLDIDKENG
ncbi:MAG: trigger factor [Spirochaetes bacterium]|nr:MAG: trigger factor [Spirochaetota bacterium]